MEISVALLSWQLWSNLKHKIRLFWGIFWVCFMFCFFFTRRINSPTKQSVFLIIWYVAARYEAAAPRKHHVSSVVPAAPSARFWELPRCQQSPVHPVSGNQVIPIKVACVVYWGRGRTSQTWRNLGTLWPESAQNNSQVQLIKPALILFFFYCMAWEWAQGYETQVDSSIEFTQTASPEWGGKT